MKNNPRSRSSQLGTRIIAALILMSLGWGAVHLYRRLRPLPVEVRQYRHFVTTNHAAQPKREETIESLQAAGLITAIAGHGRYTDVLVGPAFYRKDAATRQRIAGVVFATYWSEDKTFQEVILKDRETGQRVASYTSAGYQAR
jgi:hypothetical protein